MKRDSIYGGQGQLPGIQNRLWQCLAPNQWPGTWGQRLPPWIYLLFEEHVGRYKKSKNGEALPTLIPIITALPVVEKDFLNPVPFVGISHITPHGHLPTPPIWCLPCSASHHWHILCLLEESGRPSWPHLVCYLASMWGNTCLKAQGKCSVLGHEF